MAGPRERPILFSGPMVRALLEGRKTQTRRLVKLAGLEEAVAGHFYPSVGLAVFRRADGRESMPVPCPFRRPGDHLWVRETWALEDCGEDGERVIWQADREAAWREELDERFYLASDYQPEEGWKPSIHMPRWASRLLLEVTEVRVQRLQDITEEDAQAEGARRFEDIPLSELSASLPWGVKQAPRWSMETPRDTGDCLGTARLAFANYINQIHGGPLWNCKAEPPLWDTNLWVWALSFRRVEGSR